MKKLLSFIAPLLIDDPEIIEEQYEFEEIQMLLSKVVHMIETNSLEEHYAMLNLIKETIKIDDAKRIKFQYPTICFGYLHLITMLHEHGKDKTSTSNSFSEFSNNAILEIWKIVLEMCKLMKVLYPELSIRTLLFGMLVYSKIGHSDMFEETSMEYASLVVEIFEDEITDSDTKMRVVSMIVAHWQVLTACSNDNFMSICQNLVKVSAKLLKKQDQIRSILSCTHLFFSKALQDRDLVQQCIKKCIKICDTCKGAKKNMCMYMCILNKQMYYYCIDEEIIKPTDINETTNTIKNIIANRAASEAELKLLTTQYEQFKSHLAHRIQVSEALKTKLSEISV